MLDAASQHKTDNGSLTAASALRIAWIAWIGLLIIPFLLFLYVVWQFAHGEPAPRHNGSEAWFLISSFYLLAVVPASFFWRAHLFRSYWSGNPVQPGKYLLGMLSVWLALEIGGLFSLVGCLTNDALLPNLAPALIAFVFFVIFWPAGRAMTRRVGNSEDPEVYKQPN